MLVKGASKEENQRYGDFLKYMEMRRQEAKDQLEKDEARKEEARKKTERWNLLRTCLDYLAKRRRGGG